LIPFCVLIYVPGRAESRQCSGGFSPPRRKIKLLLDRPYRYGGTIPYAGGGGDPGQRRKAVEGSVLSFVAQWRLNTLVPSENTEQRKLAAIMFTDMVGYSALSQRKDAHIKRTKIENSKAGFA
jgi:hypothetical protein